MNIFFPFNRVTGLWIGVFSILIISLSSCGIYKPVDARKVPPNVKDRAIKSIEEGRGLSIGDVFGGDGAGGTSFSFASSNPMWRATLEILDFLPLANVDYAGGIVSTDWYNEGTSSDESISLVNVHLNVCSPADTEYEFCDQDTSPAHLPCSTSSI